MRFNSSNSPLYAKPHLLRGDNSKGNANIGNKYWKADDLRR